MVVVRMKRRRIIASLGFLMLMGVAVYFRLWAIHYTISSDDSELLRRQFDIANREAMDESAEWRLRYDQAVDRESKCLQELQGIKGTNNKFKILQKENAILLERLETLKREVEDQKLKCNSRKHS
ncbi:uncharacterized protein LOC130961887 [Arachis stenosperma]|uniref:uncharacterized protein LOC130961887 n=1 Tax=Arachis stenosperma TaxID=217475 RepID=UPI0025AC8516|nr:uncharacterized protein LOC130961887 [Arachis stenosperma]